MSPQQHRWPPLSLFLFARKRLLLCTVLVRVLCTVLVLVRILIVLRLVTAQIIGIDKLRVRLMRSDFTSVVHWCKIWISHSNAWAAGAARCHTRAAAPERDGKFEASADNESSTIGNFCYICINKQQKHKPESQRSFVLPGKYGTSAVRNVRVQYTQHSTVPEYSTWVLLQIVIYRNNKSISILVTRCLAWQLEIDINQVQQIAARMDCLDVLILLFYWYLNNWLVIFSAQWDCLCIL